MKLHEYQSKAVLKAAGLPVPNSIMVKTADEVETALKNIDMSVGLVKAQAHTGGRGKAGGVKFFKSVEEAKTLAEQIIGMTLVTKQTGAEGILVEAALLEAALSDQSFRRCPFGAPRFIQKPPFQTSHSGGAS